MNRARWILFASALAVFATQAPAQEGGEPAAGDAAKETESTADGFDRIELKNGSIVLGEIVGMEGGTLTVKIAFGVDKVVKVKWSEIAKIETGRDHTFVLDDGSRIKGKVVRTEDGKVVVVSATLEGESGLPLEKVTAVNPPEKKPLELVGTINFGGSVADGNTQTKAATFSADAVAQSKKQRLTLRAAWNYSEDSQSGITARNTKGGIKYDYFVTDRAFVFASAFFEEDRFQNLNLRTAVSGGPGYQFIKKGDFKEDWLKELEIYGEAGLAFFNEDFRTGDDQRYVSARWSLKVDWPIVPGITFFHFHEGYPGFERSDDIYLNTEQGIRFKIWGDFVSTLQINWRWDNTPSPGFERSDTLYLATLGYQFRL